MSNNLNLLLGRPGFHNAVLFVQEAIHAWRPPLSNIATHLPMATGQAGFRGPFATRLIAASFTNRNLQFLWCPLGTRLKARHVPRRLVCYLICFHQRPVRAIEENKIIRGLSNVYNSREKTDLQLVHGSHGGAAHLNYFLDEMRGIQSS